MQKIKRYKKSFLILITAALANTVLCFNDSPDPTPMQVVVLNNFNANIVFEIWTGGSIEYDLGEVKGYNLINEQTVTAIGLGAGSSVTVDIRKENKPVLVIFGEDQGGGIYYYQGDIKTTTGHTVEIGATGTISAY